MAPPLYKLAEVVSPSCQGVWLTTFFFLDQYISLRKYISTLRHNLMHCQVIYHAKIENIGRADAVGKMCVFMMLEFLGEKLSWRADDKLTIVSLILKTRVERCKGT